MNENEVLTKPLNDEQQTAITRPFCRFRPLCPFPFPFSFLPNRFNTRAARTGAQ